MVIDSSAWTQCLIQIPFIGYVLTLQIEHSSLNPCGPGNDKGMHKYLHLCGRSFPIQSLMARVWKINQIGSSEKKMFVEASHVHLQIGGGHLDSPLPMWYTHTHTHTHVTHCIIEIMEDMPFLKAKKKHYTRIANLGGYGFFLNVFKLYDLSPQIIIISIWYKHCILLEGMRSNSN